MQGGTTDGTAPLARQLWFQLVVAVTVGVLVGHLLQARAAALGELGTTVVRLLKALATPLVFFAIVDAVARSPMTGKMGARLLAICFTNTLVAALLSIGLGLLIAPGLRSSAIVVASTARTAAPGVSAHNVLDAMFPESLVRPFVENQVLVVVLLAFAVGLALRKMLSSEGAPGQRLAGLVSEALLLFQVLLGWVVRVVPLAICGVVAGVVGTMGVDIFRKLAWLVATVSLGLVLHVVVYYSLLLRIVGKRPLAFWRACSEPLLTALSTGSSLATLPVTLRTLDRLGVRPAASRLAACIGTNFNNDGIMLYEVVAAIFIAQLTGHPLSVTALVLLCATSAFAAAGIAGIPEAGLVTLTLVLEAAHLPTELVPILLTVDWLLGRLRATTNVASDLVVSAMLDASSAQLISIDAT